MKKSSYKLDAFFRFYAYFLGLLRDINIICELNAEAISLFELGDF